MSIKFLVLGEEGILGLGRGGGVPILFLWVRGFSDKKQICPISSQKTSEPQAHCNATLQSISTKKSLHQFPRQIRGVYFDRVDGAVTR